MGTLISIIQALMAIFFIIHGIAMFHQPLAVQESVIQKWVTPYHSSNSSARSRC